MRKPKEIIINGKTLEEILINHKHWINEDCYGWENMRADLVGADLRGARLCGANLHDARLCDADLCGADLHDANLCSADLRGADLRRANLCDAWLDKNEEARKGIKLTENIIGWKKCRDDDGDYVIVKLEIPRGAIVFSINNHKCRTDKAKVLEIIGKDRAFSDFNNNSYYVGDVIEVFDFNCEYNEECASGIHFFRTREDAEEYRL